MNLPPHLERLRVILTSAFPAGVSATTRRALLIVLWDELSEENFGRVLAEFLDDEAVVIVDEAIKAVSGSPDSRRAQGVKAELRAHGWPFEDD